MTRDDDVRINLIFCEDVIKQDIAGGATQKDVAVSYAMAMKSEAHGDYKSDWREINGAILSKWKMSGLERIKKLAHDYASGRKSP